MKWFLNLTEKEGKEKKAFCRGTTGLSSVRLEAGGCVGDIKKSRSDHGEYTREHEESSNEPGLVNGEGWFLGGGREV